MKKILLVVFIASAGCTNQGENHPKKEESTARSSKTDGYIWEREKRPYRLTWFDQKNACPVGVEHRYASVVYPNPPSRDAFEKAIREVYSEFRADIYRTCPRAKHKLINIRFYFDKREDPLGHIVCHATAGAAAEIPVWPPTELKWKWRDKSSAPSPRDREIYFDYMERLGVADKKSWEAYEGRPITRAEMFEQQRLYKQLKQKARAQLCRDWKITEEQRERIWWHNFYWLQGMKVTSKMIDDAVRNDH